MVGHQCPHCNFKPMSRNVLETHIRHVHGGINQQAGPAAVIAPATPGNQPQGSVNTAQPAGVVVQAPLNPSPFAPPTAQPGTMGPPPIPNPTPQGHFTFILDTRNTPIVAHPEHVPTNEPFTDFQNRLRSLSIPLAGHYITGRANGFSLIDGLWRYAFIERNSAQGEPRALDRPLFYHSMISELTRAGSSYTHALIWHDVQDRGLPPPQGVQGVSTYEGGSSVTGDQQGGFGSSTNEGVGSAGGQARIPAAILGRRETFGNVEYQVEFREGGMPRWMTGNEMRDAGRGDLPDDWERRNRDL